MAQIEGWIEVNNFTPGIFSDYHAGTGMTNVGQNGAATIDNTFGCCAEASGALVPLPAAAQIQNFHFPTLPSVTMHVGDFMVGGPGSSGGIYEDAALYYALWYSSSVTGGAVDYMGIYQVTTSDDYAGVYPYYVAHVTITPVFFTRAVPAASGASMDRGVSASWSIAVPVPLANMLSETVGVFSSKGTAVAAIPASETNSIANGYWSANYPAGIQTYGSAVAVIPNPNTGNQSTSAGVPDAPVTTQTPLVCGHQGRMVFAGHNTDASTATREIIYYTQPNRILDTVNTLSAGAGTIYIEENQSGIGAICSVGASDLLIIKRKGGGALVRGDLDNPTVTRMPYLESTFDKSSRPIVTPLGVVYATANGIFLWDGRQPYSQKLSPQIEGAFWSAETPNYPSTYDGYQGRMAYWDDSIFVGNSYLYKTNIKSWWRLEDPTSTSIGGTAKSPQMFFDVSPSTNRLYASSAIIDTTTTPMAIIYLQNLLRSTYSWQSQPLIETTGDQLLEFQALELISTTSPNASGTQTVAVTITGFNIDGTATSPITTTFTLTNSPAGRIVPLRQNLHPNITGARYAQIKIVATSAAGPAPKVNAVRIGYRNNQSIPFVGR